MGNPHNTSGVVSKGGHGPALATPDRTGQERSVDSGHERDERGKESGETGDSGAGESGAQERGEREASAATKRMVSSSARRVA